MRHLVVGLSGASGVSYRPQTLDDVVNQTVNRVLDLLDIELPTDLFVRWSGPRYASNQRREGPRL